MATELLPADQEMMARVLAGQEHLTVEQQLRNACESFEIVQKDNVRLYALCDKQDDEIEQLKLDLAQQTANASTIIEMQVELGKLKSDNERLRAGLLTIATGGAKWPVGHAALILYGEEPTQVDVGDKHGDV